MPSKLDLFRMMKSVNINEALTCFQNINWRGEILEISNGHLALQSKIGRKFEQIKKCIFSHEKNLSKNEQSGLKDWFFGTSRMVNDLIESNRSFLKNGTFPGPFYLYFCLFSTVDRHVQYKFCRWMDLNRGPLVLDATAPPTEPQPMPINGSL